MIKLSFIIPVYNAEIYLERCVNSCLAQGFEDNEYEILLCNDGSTDGSLRLAKRLSAEHRCIKVFSQENAGAGMARNLGLKYAMGCYVVFIDSDDYINYVDLNSYYHIAEGNNLDLLRFSFKVYNSEGQFSINQMLQFNDNQVYTGAEAILLDYTIGSACGTLFKKDFLAEYGFHFRDDMAHEDCEFMLRLLPKVNRMMVSSACLYTYCWNANSTDRSRSVRNIVRLKQSDVFVAQSYFATADKESVNSPISKYYHRKGNSLLTQFLLSLIYQTKQLSLNTKMELLSFANLQGVYPTRSFRTLSWKTTLILFFLNRPKIEKFLLQLFNRKKK